MAHERADKAPSAWARRATDLLVADRAAEPSTPLDPIPLPGRPGTALFLKDESRRPSGSSEHGPARDLLLDALGEGRVDRGTALFDAAVGDTAVAQAYFARLLGLEYTAVVPERTDRAELRRIEAWGGRWYTAASPSGAAERARELAELSNGHFLDHVHRADDAVDWSGPYALGAEILSDATPAWVVMTDGLNSLSVGRCLRLLRPTAHLALATRPGAEPALAQDVGDLTIPVPDTSALAALRHLHAVTGHLASLSAGHGLWAAFEVLNRMRRAGVQGSVVVVAGGEGEVFGARSPWTARAEDRGLELAGRAGELDLAQLTRTQGRRRSVTVG
ncbi:pyridoxal-phosphate dependent enzyme [Streptomyces sp. NPDC088387]|uniref:pyridoxal-phosphate dependent enzyme n=1 Tax=Streptomyces sp. NPDC088387 TaxID=3365859 RepID=UPI003808F7FE